jgi:hypothetical protein
LKGKKQKKKDKKATIKRMSTIFNIKTKRNKIKWKGGETKRKKQSKKESKTKKD